MGKFEIFNASAGAGKTYALVKNFLKICLESENPMKFREILAITFTNKAANEMKVRIIDKLKSFVAFNNCKVRDVMLDQLSDEIGVSVETLSYRAEDVLKSILHNYSAFSVSTIDKFTNRLIRSFAQDLKLNANYEIELDSREMLGESIDQLLANLTEGSLTARILLQFIENNLEEGKSPRPEKNLLEMGDNLFKEEAIPFIKALNDIGKEGVIKAKDEFYREKREIAELIQKEARELLELITSNGIKPEDFSGKTVFNYITNVAQGYEEKWPPNKTVLRVVDGGSFYAKGKSRDLEPLFSPIEGELRDRLSSLVEKCVEFYPRQHLISRILKDIYSLAALAEIEQQLQELKNETNRLPIGEFNKLVSEKLEKEPAAYLFEKLGDRYHHFFIDEFQDTSVLQWRNLLPLINNAMASRGSVMIVGDGKQSIYRWRGGDVNQFLGLSNNEDHSNKVKTNKGLVELYPRERVTLGSNFRSRRTVVEFNNDFFLSAADLLAAEPHRQLYSQSEQAPENMGEGYVEIQLLKYDKDAKDQFDQLQCQQCLTIIKNCQNRGFGLNQMAIITRTKTHGAILAEYLLNEGINVISPDSLQVGSSEEVKVIISFLQTLVRPDDHERRWDLLQFLWTYLKLEDDFIDAHDFVNQYIKSTSSRLFEFMAAKLPGFAIRILQTSSLHDGVYFLASLFNLNIQKNPFLHCFMDIVSDFQRNDGESIMDFLRKWEDKYVNKTIALPEGVDAINLMTIHKSKGLEFPITIIPYADWIATNDKRNAAWLDLRELEMYGLPAARLGLSSINLEYAFPVYRELYQENKCNIYLDNLNLAYVAFTRAVDELYIIGSYDRRDDSQRLTRYIDNYFKNNEVHGKSMAIGAKVFPVGVEPLRVGRNENGIRTYNVGNWRNKLEISVNAPMNWQAEEDSAVAYGRKIHNLLAQLAKAGDAAHILKSARQRGDFRDEEFPQIEQTLTGLLKDPRLSKYYEAGMKTFNEVEILVPGQRTHRPDRVVIEDGKAHIVDYKTGSSYGSHREQVNQYRDLLRIMGYETGDNVLVYIGGETEVIKW